MLLFEQVKRGILSNEELVKQVVDEFFVEKIVEEIKVNFFYYVNEIQYGIYQKYFQVEKVLGQ